MTVPSGEAGENVRGSLPYEWARLVMVSLFRLAGWKSTGQTPSMAKFVAIGAPHTSNWDFLFMLSVMLERRIDLYWMGKHTLFRWPFGGLMRRLGGIPVDRGSAAGVVEQMVEEFGRREAFALAVAPEGTRGGAERWKTGFYRIAHLAGVPIIPCTIDYPSRTIAIGEPFMPNGDTEADIEALRALYRNISGKPRKA